MRWLLREPQLAQSFFLMFSFATQAVSVSLKAFHDEDNKPRKLDLLKRWVNSGSDIKECTVSLIISEMRKKSEKTKRAWLSEGAILEHYFKDEDRTKEACFLRFM